MVFTATLDTITGTGHSKHGSILDRTQKCPQLYNRSQVVRKKLKRSAKQLDSNNTKSNCEHRHRVLCHSCR